MSHWQSALSTHTHSSALIPKVTFVLFGLPFTGSRILPARSISDRTYLCDLLEA
jgi:hypothetical protein